MTTPSPHIENREKLVHFIRSEMIGPCLTGDKLDCSGEIKIEKWEDAGRPRVQKENGDEIISKETPVNRYGIGVLYPRQVLHEETLSTDKEGPADLRENTGDDEEQKITEIKSVGKLENEISDTDDFDLSLTSTLQPSSMAVSFLAELPEGSALHVSVDGGRYLQKAVTIEGTTRRWFLRHAVSIPDISFKSDTLKTNPFPEPVVKEFEKGLIVSVECYSRPDIYSAKQDRINRRLITICLVNRTVKQAISASEQSEFSLFQAGFSAQITGGGQIRPYPDAGRYIPTGENELTDDEKEQASFRLLYNTKKTYAIGHGCAASWEDKTANPPDFVRADPLPEYEIPSITPDARKADGSNLKISMTVLAGLETGADELLRDFLAEYYSWIEIKKEEGKKLDLEFQEATGRHIENAEICSARMLAGLEYLNEDPLAGEAFRLANKAVLMQQLTGNQKRLHDFDQRERKNRFDPIYQDIDFDHLPENTGYWRAFQIGFILSSLKSSILDCEKCAERDDVELIWFPTGGGKTEAYLGLAAFAMFYRRLVDQHDDGVHVLMRYTLRLLTTQQFQRGSRLICAMERIRQQHGSLGGRPFSIGIWVGSANTPNKRTTAVTAYNKMRTYGKAENPFILRQCPWCGAEMGKQYKIGTATNILGYGKNKGTILFKCPDKKCPFHNSLPVNVIDEDIYENRPSLIIGTVDKFAMLAWMPEAGALFGLNMDGEREKKPPGLIIQDELHLISGPLGTMVGLYETVIEELCTDRTNDRVLKPKIVCSTATIRRYQDQVRCLFARQKAILFPPPGLNAGDSFFARYAVDSEGCLLPGRRYLGLYAPGLPSMQTLQVRLFSSILMGSMLFEKVEERDPWWTLLLFYNSIRELGGALSLFQTDIPGALKGMASRHGIKDRRFLNKVLELTSRMTNEEVPLALEELGEKYTGKRTHAVDVCLASSIIEVGIDVDRLSLMAIVGQPKTIAQYIQVSGRVGRKWWERPGLVTTLYSSSKARDRSHFEKFQSSHSQLYAQVEPSSVTPFSPPVIDRALHALFAIYLRLFGNECVASSPSKVDKALLDQLKKLIMNRVQIVDSSETDYVMEKFEKRLRQFNKWQRTWWSNYQEQADSMLRRYETWVTEEMAEISWATPTSMRNVDAECQMDITTRYNLDSEEE
jgi:hypothetical protein